MTTYREIPDALTARRDFKVGRECEGTANPVVVNQGHLGADEFDRLDGALGRGLLEYIVYSYATPVAWVADGTAYVVEQKVNRLLQDVCRNFL